MWFFQAICSSILYMRNLLRQVVKYVATMIERLKFVRDCEMQKFGWIKFHLPLFSHSWRSSVTTMLNSLDWPTFESRHLYSKLVMLIIKGYIEVQLSLIPIHTSTRGHSQHLRPPFTSLNNTYIPLCLQQSNFGTIFQKTLLISHLCLILKNLYIVYIVIR